MNFTLGFYSFNVNLNDSSRGIYTSFRVKTPRHPYESLEHLNGRVLAFAHSYQEGLDFSQGLFEEKEPTIWKKDILGKVAVWLQIGVPDRRKLERALKQNPRGDFRIYFYEPAQIEAFCWMLRGSKTNWVEPIAFHQIDPVLLEELAQHDVSSSSWDLTILDSTVYLNVNGRDYVSEIQPIDIWEEFQIAIQKNPDANPADM